jgi:two-component system LytT family sensor kinase
MQNQKTQTKIEQNHLEKQALEAKKGFKINLTAYAAVNSMLVTINMLTVPQFPWFLFPMCGWGFGLTMHYIFGVRRLGKQAEAQRQMVQ